MRLMAQNYRQRFIFSYVLKSQIEGKESTLVKNLLEYLGLGFDDFPSLRIVRMSNNSFFGQKYKMPVDNFHIADLRSFFNKMISKKIKTYSKTQKYSKVENYNNRNIEKIANFSKMMMLHQNNFNEIIENRQKQFGYLMYVYSNAEICEKCSVIEELIMKSFNKVIDLMEERLLVENRSSNDPQKQDKAFNISKVIKVMKKKLVMTKVNAQLDEINNWVFEMVPELVLVYPGGNTIKNFDHFDNENGLLSIIEKFLSNVYYGIVDGEYKQFYTVKDIETEL